MKGALRKTMTWLHTWSSILLGWLLFAIFLTGTLSYFRGEISHWMTPEAHVSAPSDEAINHAVAYLQEAAPQANSWSIGLPTARSNTVELSWQNPGDNTRRRGPMAEISASDGSVIEGRETRGGDFLYRFHFELYHVPRDVARFIVEVATMAMFIALISGIIMHRHIFSHFFFFRTKNRSLGWHDAHAVTAVLSLPFHLMITFSGLLFLSSSLIFWGDGGEVRGGQGGGGRNGQPMAMERGGKPQGTINMNSITPLADLQTMLANAETQLGSEVSRVQIEKPLTPQVSYVFSPTYRDTLTGGRGGQSARFDQHGDFVALDDNRESADLLSVSTFTGVLRTLHEARFADGVVRWLFFITGIGGTLMVATGSILWATKRAKRQAGQFGFELIHTLNIASIAGLCAACAGYFWANRLLPADLANRADWEIHSFFGVWALSLIHAMFWRNRRGWETQLWVTGALFLLLPVLDQFTSPVGVFTALWQGDWLRISFDLMVLLIGGILLAAAAYLHRTGVSVKAGAKDKTKPATNATMATETQEAMAK